MAAGLVAGVVLGVLVEFVTALTSKPRQPHPSAAFAAFTGSRFLLWTYWIVVAASFVLMMANLTTLVSAVRNPVLEAVAGVFLGLFGGQMAVRLFLAAPAGRWLFGAVGRAFLSYSGELPWRLRRFLRYTAHSDLMQENVDGSFEFRHQLFLEYFSGRMTQQVRVPEST